MSSSSTAVETHIHPQVLENINEGEFQGTVAACSTFVGTKPDFALDLLRLRMASPGIPIGDAIKIEVRYEIPIPAQDGVYVGGGRVEKSDAGYILIFTHLAMVSED